MPPQPPQFTGILELDAKRFGFVRSPSKTLAPAPADPYVPASLVAQFGLRTGVLLEGILSESGHRSGSGATSRDHTKGTPVKTITRVNGKTPEEWREVMEFSLHEVVSPDEVLVLSPATQAGAMDAGTASMRVVELFCPLGKGQRALIVSPPKAGKTVLMQHLAASISKYNAGIDLLVLLIDERPEEVTDMRRSIKGEVFASSSDSEKGSHVRLAQLVLEYAKRKTETGGDVVVLLDSLTRLGRAFNIHQKSSGRTLSGGVDIRALEIPKRIFGAARKIEHGGSLTIVATALVDTNSRMDELIFQEFKGTGNMELVLDRDLANERIFPSINLTESGTRREELLFGGALAQHQTLRRSIARKSPKDAMLAMLKLMERFPTNDQLLAQF